MGGSCEHVNEPPSSIKFREFLIDMQNCQLLKKDSAA
jgi:hypothetical protein